MKLLFLTFLTLLCTCVRAEVTSTATSGSGSGYPALLASGFQLEDPDCIHTGFGARVTQAFDTELNRNVFVFHSHVTEDNDRCLVFDRVRMEIKGSSNSIPELQHARGDTTYYRWKFRLDEGFIGASSFNHLYQNKAVGGEDTSFPILTITARANKVEVKHDGGATGTALGSVAEADITKFRGKWVEGYLRQVHEENGELTVTIRDMETGLTILEYTNNDIDLWRAGAQLNRPKWGVYRSKNDALRDEEVRFANFCVSEEAEALCPAEAVLVPDTEAPTVPGDLAVTGTTFTTVSLNWEAAEDTYGVSSYVVYADGDSIASTTETEATLSGLATATTYSFTVTARDAAGNESAPGNAVEGTTDDANATGMQPTAPSDTISITVVAQDGLSSLTYRVITVGVTATFNPQFQAAIKVFPNPASGFLTVEVPNRGLYTAQLVALDGRTLTGEFSISERGTIDVSAFPKGVYVLVVRSASGQLARTRIVVE